MSSTATQWILELVDEITSPMKDIQKQVEDTSSAFNEVRENLASFDSETQAIVATSLQAHEELTKGIELEQKALENLTGWLKETGDALDPLSKATFNVEIEAAENKIRRYKEQLTEINHELADVATTNKALGKEASVAGESVNKVLNDMESFDFLGVSGGFKAIRAGILSITKAAWGFIATPIGAAIAALAAIGLVTAEFFKYNAAVREANIVTSQITKLSGDALDQARLRAGVIEEVYGANFKDTLKAAKNISQEFGVSMNDAFDSISEGMVRGGMESDSFLKAMERYPKMFAQAGFSADEFRKIINTGIDFGIYENRLPDAIKKFNTTIAEQSTQTQKALENALGKTFTKRLFSGIRDGSITPKRALADIASEAEKIGINLQQSTELGQKLFGSAAEDAGGFENVIGAVNAALNDEEIALNDLMSSLRTTEDALLDLAIAKDEALNSKSAQLFAEEMELFWIDIKTGFFEFIVWLQGALNSVTRFGTQIIAVFAELPKIIKTTFLNIMEDIKILLSTFMSFGDVVGKVLKFDFKGAKEGFKNFKKDLKEDLIALAADAIAPVIELPAVFKKQGVAVDNHRQLLQESAVATNERKKQKASETTPKGLAGAGNDFGISGSGGGGGKSITMNLDIKNYFSFAKGDGVDLEAIAVKVVGKINDRLRDSVIALG